MSYIRRHPILILLILNMAIGLLTFRDYGLSWDEPLFYDYGQASEYAYSIPARLAGTFDLEKSFGASAGDHVTRGPAYLVTAGLFENILEYLGLDIAAAWHLTNFLTFQVCLIFFYLFIRRWLDVWPATLSTAFFATQPVLWNHAFVNPKDIPFATFFLMSVYLGFRMVDTWNQASLNTRILMSSTILPGIVLGFTTSIRFIGPYAGLLVFLLFISTKNWKAIWAFIPYGTIALVTMYFFWPFLWPDPIGKFAFVLQAMANAPSDLKILFMGNLYPAYELPRRYFPTLLTYTLTEPTWFLFIIGTVIAFKKAFQESKDRARFGITFLWFGLIISALIIINPPNSDGYRHYLFILPPVFIFAGFAINEILIRIHHNAIKSLVILMLFLPAIVANITLHPYQYTYYNTFIGGTGNAFRQYETDYWLTCYREAIMDFEKAAPQGSQLYVKREPYIAEYYANSAITIRDYRTELKDIKSGDFALINTRSNDDEKILKGAPVFIEIGRGNAIFCVIKQVP
jgi:hypothetical protein